MLQTHRAPSSGAFSIPGDQLWPTRQRISIQDSVSAVPVVLFGVDQNGKPKAARFPENQANLATKAAGHLKLHVLPIIGPVVVDLAGRVPAGRIHANGRGFVPYIRHDLYAKLVAAAGSPAHGDHASTQAAAASGSTKPSSPNGQGDPPKNYNGVVTSWARPASRQPERLGRCHTLQRARLKQGSR
jgi:hypothetical protein